MTLSSVLIAVLAGAAAFAVSVVVVPAGALTPPNEMFPLFALLTVLESAAFGVGAAYVVRARRRLFGAGIGLFERGAAWCVAYLLLAPAVHDYLHRITYVNGVFNWPVVAGIEYVFHLGVVPVGAVIAAYVIRTGQVRRA